MTKEIENYKNEGFTGFMTVSKLFGNTAIIPDFPGVYIVVRESDDAPKATNLRKRLSQLLRFGAGSAIGHWGGRYLWQLADSADLLIAWKPTPEADPRSEEKQMLDEFVSLHGRLPFANLSK